MKRLVIITAAALMLMCCAIGCGAKRDKKYIGKWEATEMMMDGTKYTDMLGVPLSALFSFEIKKDGKVIWRSAVDNKVIQNANENVDITWKQTGDDSIQIKVTDLKGKEPDNTMDMKYRDGMLVIEEEGSYINITKVDEFTEINPDDINAAAGVIQNFGITG
ncbi:hypothetical protein [Ruminococcus sp.]|uniref:hypothetical protein n=1 Tax=Ruminococcus sp. TaxID=41978 RepID=UPI0025D62A41|nr:hypothetical protein [Ruminococcus sp.]MBQ6250660.1 hypothetical protein [Ruminococcus sp.]MBR3667496.1 hypothetical protein [Ruminococcus sp.]MBR6995073.1 hypothetical protein [Ruminococcus sp.]